MKQGKAISFFDGEISDGKASVRLYGFDKKLREKIERSVVTNESVTLSGCEVKTGRNEKDGFEVLVKSGTEVLRSEREFAVKFVDLSKDSEMKIHEVKELNQFVPVAVKCKVVRVEDSFEVSGGKRLQYVYVSDDSGCIKLCLWEEAVGTLFVGKSYLMKGLYIKQYLGKKHLQPIKGKSSFTEIEDVSEAVEDIEDTDHEEGQKLECVRVLGVSYFGKERVCIECEGKVVEKEDDAELGICSRCNMVQVKEACQTIVTGQLLVGNSSGRFYVRGYGKVLYQIADAGENIDEKLLLKCKPFSLMEVNGVVRSVWRK